MARDIPDRERFAAYMRRRLQETGVTARKLSLAMGADQSYIGQLLDPPPARSRALPTPDMLRAAAPLLGVPLVELLEVTWGIGRAELERDLETMATHQGACATEMDDLTTPEREEVMNFIGYVKAKREMRRAHVQDTDRGHDRAAGRRVAPDAVEDLDGESADRDGDGDDCGGG